jgi:transposase InsO family protein
VIESQGKESDGGLTIEKLCREAGVSRASYYRDWEEREPDQARMRLRDAVQQESLRQRSCGAPKMTEILRRQGFVVSVATVSRIRRDDNLLAVRKRKFVRTTDSDPSFLAYPNLARQMKLSGLNQLWVADLTYLRLSAEFLYLAVVLDAFSRRVLGWALGRSLETTLPLTALERALAARKPAPGLVHHSDRGTQYASNDYVARLEAHNIIMSMSRPARPWENARCERFMRTLKEEEIQVREYRTKEQLEANIEDFIENYYNRQRLHAALHYLTPVEFEQQCQAAEPAAEPPALPVIAGMSFRRHQEIFPDAHLTE